MSMNMRRLLALSLSILMAAVAVIAVAARSAGAQPNPGPPGDGPQSANIPYVAWVGEQVHLVACDPNIVRQNAPATEDAFLSLDEWSGDQGPADVPTFDGTSQSSNPLFELPSSTAFFAPSDPSHTSFNDGCVEADVKALKAGLATITLNVYREGGNATSLAYTQQFYVIWLQANAPTLSEASVESLEHPGTPGSDAPPTTFSQLNGAGMLNAAQFLGDPSGDGQFRPDALPYTTSPNPATNNGLVQIKVTGTFPVEDATEAAFLGAGSFTLPNDWAKLASRLATSSTQPTGVDPSLWDIHGGPTDPGPGPMGGCPVNSNTNCVGGLAQFSRVFGSLTTNTVGPYDPEAADHSLLSDGHLNSDDAPMPALPVTVSIAPNTGVQDNGGVGGLYSAGKQVIYSHDFTGNPAAENLYNPFYSAYIPATRRGETEASGVGGIGGDDFPGLNTGSNPYQYWTALNPSTTDVQRPTACLDHTSGTVSSVNASGPDYYQTPGYPTRVMVYTDERGEAYVRYNPGNGIYFNALLAQGKISVDNNNACDLQALYGQVIGTSTISAQTEYPYQTVPYQAPAASNTLTKVVRSQWSKTLTAYPKLNSSPVPTSIFVARAVDIDGNPISGEIVCFGAPGSNVSYYGGANAIVKDANGIPVADLSGSPWTPVPPGALGSVCSITNASGEAAAEVSNSDPNANVDVTAEFFNEGLLRDVYGTLGVHVTPPQTTTTTTTTTPSPPPTTTTSSTLTSTSTDSSVSRSTSTASSMSKSTSTASSTTSVGSNQTTSTVTSSGSSSQSASAPVVVGPGTTGTDDPPHQGGYSTPAKHAYTYIAFARAVHRHGHWFVTGRIASSSPSVTIVVRYYAKNDKVKRTVTDVVKANAPFSVKIAGLKSLQGGRLGMALR